ncbi:MFS transporter [Halobellus ruber]|uniref:MFS transporter n=1 Tax=Halobellus ruber TaxID=2761102 RepID=A0A7J9SGF8_9EURY|nr:MFS transporter [Halobellus ruber]MBB6646045.1 MFS transporter [Halobellus ruber]
MRDSSVPDARILSLAIARMVSALANSFLVVVLPLYIGSGAVRLPAVTGSTATVFGVGIDVSVELLIAIVLSVFGFLNSLSQPLTGSVSDRTGRRKVFLLFGLGLVATGSAGYLLFTDYLLVLAMRGLQGVGAAFSIPIAVALVNELSDSAERGNNFGLFNTFRLLGFGIGPLVAGVVVASGPYAVFGRPVSGYDAAFLVAVAGAVVSFGLVSLLITDPEPTETAGEGLSVRVRGEDGGLDPVFALALATIVMALSIAIYAPLANVINERLNQGSFLYSIQFGASILANVLFQLPIGRLSDRYGRRPFLVAGFLLLLPTTLAQGLVTSSNAMIIARFLQGVAVAAVFAPSLALAGDLAREGASGSTLSLLTMGFGLGIASGILMAGVLVSFGFVVPFAVATGAGAVGLGLIVTQVAEPDRGDSVAAPAAD